MAPVSDVVVLAGCAVMCAMSFWAVAAFALGRCWQSRGLIVSWAGRCDTAVSAFA